MSIIVHFLIEIENNIIKHCSTKIWLRQLLKELAEQLHESIVSHYGFNILIFASI